MREETGLSCDRADALLQADHIQAALETLQRHDVVKQHDEHYIYTVELMHRWVSQRTGR
jgi:hypothetical protein